jgi:hypothetical protein
MAALRESRGHLSFFLFPRVYNTSLEAKQEFQSKKENGCCVWWWMGKIFCVVVSFGRGSWGGV